MAKLDNPKHEAFAGHLARGLSQTKAYTQAGYNPNPAGASKLANSPAVIARVEELKTEIAIKINAAMDEPNEDTFGELAASGLTMDWIAQRFKTLSLEAQQAGQFSAAIKATENLQKIVELKGRGNGSAEEEDTSPKISLKDMTKLIQAQTDLIKAHKASEEPEMVDITPKELPDDHEE